MSQSILVFDSARVDRVQLAHTAHQRLASRSALVAEKFSLAAQAGLLAGPFLSMVDSNIVNVAIPDIARQLGTPLATAQWVVSGYLLALAAGFHDVIGLLVLVAAFGTAAALLLDPAQRSSQE